MTDTLAIAAELRRLLPHAHAPYSGVQVAAAVEAEDGGLRFGVNVENAAYPQGLCAEASAIAAAITQGAKQIRCVYIASSLPGLVWPCGGCRQKIFEFASEGCEVVTISPAGQIGRQSIDQLLPFGFRLDAAQVRRG
ncbi:cytidine deaminase [Phenylobacterium sp.]|jgi:cytidine deaminase|uniref:cytidine deaminase n=1 Tax=Phenylobacterium sp. TaxID=1871053 RepID=UPI002F41209E